MHKNIRLGTLSIKEVLDKVSLRDEDLEDSPRSLRKARNIRHTFFKKDSVKISSLRLSTFKQKGTVCKACGLEAQYFAIEKQGGQPTFHMNLYGVNAEGEEILFTKDHIHPKSLGGINALNNMATMCNRCNMKKGNSIEGETI